MTDAARRTRPAGALLALLLAGVLAFAGFCGLGVWQVKRLAWKQALIAQVERQLQAAPVSAPGPTQWPALRRTQDEYRRVRVQGRFDPTQQTLVRASTELGAGYWVLTPLRTDSGFWVLVNRGFVAPEWRTHPAPPPAGAQRVTGLLRFSEPRGSLLQANEPAAQRWYSRDVPAIAAAQGLRDVPVAPYFIDEGADAASAQRWPRPGLTVLRFSNNHLVYAITWFLLAAMCAGAIGHVLIDERRQRGGSARS